MKVNRGWFFAVLGFAVLVGSLVLSTPFAGHGSRKEPARPGRPTAAPAGEAEPALGAPRRADHAQAYQETGPIVFRADETEAQLSFPVPLGRRLVIESVSVRAHAGAGQRVAVVFMTTLGAGSAHFAVPLAPQGSLGKAGEVFAATLPVRATAGPGTSVWFKVERSAPGESEGGFITLSGTLE